MNSLTIIGVLTAVAAAWTIRAYHLDLARERRRVARLRAVNAGLRERIDFYLDELDDSAVLLEMAARDRHPSQYGGGNLRVIRGAK